MYWTTAWAAWDRIEMSRLLEMSHHVGSDRRCESTLLRVLECVEMMHGRSWKHEISCRGACEHRTRTCEACVIVSAACSSSSEHASLSLPLDSPRLLASVRSSGELSPCADCLANHPVRRGVGEHGGTLTGRPATPDGEGAAPLEPSALHPLASGESARARPARAPAPTSGHLVGAKTSLMRAANIKRS